MAVRAIGTEEEEQCMVPGERHGHTLARVDLGAVEHLERLGVDRTPGHGVVEFRIGPDHPLRHIGEHRRLVDHFRLDGEIAPDVTFGRTDDRNVAQLLHAFLQDVEFDQCGRPRGCRGRARARRRFGLFLVFSRRLTVPEPAALAVGPVLLSGLFIRETDLRQRLGSSDRGRSAHPDAKARSDDRECAAVAASATEDAHGEPLHDGSSLKRLPSRQ